MTFIIRLCKQRTHTQIGHATTKAVNRIRALMEARAQSYATTPSTSSTAHVRQPFTANFVRSGEPCLANKNSEGQDIPSLVCIICLIQRLILCMKPFVILRPKTDLFGPLTESFSLPNNPAFKMQAFFKDHPVNRKSFSWKNLSIIYIPDDCDR